MINGAVRLLILVLLLFVATISRRQTVVGTLVYMAPEVLSNEKYSEKADIYSFGVVLWEIFTGNNPYEDERYRDLNQFQLTKCIVDNERPSLDGVEPTISQIIAECWNANPITRTSMREIIVRLRRLKKLNLKIPHQEFKDELPEDEPFFIEQNLLLTTELEKLLKIQ